LFATVWALFLPGWFSGMAGIGYANEHLSPQFFAGAVLILAANALLLRENRSPQASHSQSGPGA
jgi:hypothetical protein